MIQGHLEINSHKCEGTEELTLALILTLTLTLILTPMLTLTLKHILLVTLTLTHKS